MIELYALDALIPAPGQLVPTGFAVKVGYDLGCAFWIGYPKLRIFL
jgi:hypothetical protein